MVSDGLACCLRCCPGCAVILGCTFCNAKEAHYHSRNNSKTTLQSNYMSTHLFLQYHNNCNLEDNRTDLHNPLGAMG